MRERDAASRLNSEGMEWERDVEDGGLRGWRKRDVQDVAVRGQCCNHGGTVSDGDPGGQMSRNY